jgi:hypothetical protein
MTKKTLARMILAILIAAMLGGASLIIANSNAGAGAEAPSGFFH